MSPSRSPSSDIRERVARTIVNTEAPDPITELHPKYTASKTYITPYPVASQTSLLWSAMLEVNIFSSESSQMRIPIVVEHF